MTIFYNNKTLHNMLLIHIQEKYITNINKVGDITYFYHGNQLIAVNIANADQKMIGIPNGYIYLTDFLKTKFEMIIKAPLPDQKPSLIIGKVIDVEKVPNTHLHICKVDISKGVVLQIVCGAVNVKPGLKTVVALDGCMLPNGKIIKAGLLMGIKSQGMLCSYKELNIDNDQKGIIELDSDSVIGSIYAPAYSNLSIK